MRMAVYILHYGNPDMTRRLHSQFLSGDPVSSGDVHILDNASPCPYQSASERLPENVYWAGALAYALEAAARAEYTHVWFCNNDITFVSEPPFIARVEARLRWLERRGRVGMYSPSATSNPYHGQMVRISGSECRRVLYIDGIAPVISLACVQDIGGLDFEDNPYGYGVDVWLSLRAVKAGWNVWVDDTIVVRHRYHSAAKEVDGFMARAAEAENNYMTERLGPAWRKALAEMQETQDMQ